MVNAQLGYLPQETRVVILTSQFSELHRALIFSLCLYLNKLFIETHTLKKIEANDETFDSI